MKGMPPIACTAQATVKMHPDRHNKDLCVVCYFFFDEQSLFVVPLRRVDSWHGRQHRLRYWVLLFVLLYQAYSASQILARWNRMRYVLL